MKVALINMPFASIYRPSIGLSLLKAGLQKKDIDCDIHYLNLKFAEKITPELYDAFAEGKVFSSNALAGEMVFSESLFNKDTLDEYILEAKPKFKRTTLQDYELIREARSHVENFLDESLESINWNEYTIIGFTSVFEQNVASLSLAKRLKEKFPDKFIMLGGANCEETMGIELLKQFPFIDAICSGEGDYSFVDFIYEWKENNVIKNDIDGVFLQTDDALTMMKKKPMGKSVQNLDELPIPEYTDYFEQFVSCSYKDLVFKTRFLFESSRGCWWGQKHHCVFCGLNGGNMSFRSKSANRVLDELIYLNQKYHQYTSKATAVDNIIDMNYFKSLLPSLKQEEINLDMFYETKANLKKQQIALFKEANFSTIQPGIESLQSSVLKLMNKGITMLQNIQLLKWSKEYGVVPVWNILYGFPGENQEEYRNIDQLMWKITHLTPPGAVARIRLDRFSPYFNKYEENGLTNVRAMWPYKYIYSGIDSSGLDKLAYHFDFDYVEECDPESYTNNLKKAAVRWINFHSNSDLFYIDNEKELIIIDMRDDTAIHTLVFRNVKRQIYLALDGITSSKGVHKELSTQGQVISLEEVDSIIQEFIDQKLVLEEDSKFISLALNTKIYHPKKSSLIRLQKWNSEKNTLKEVQFT